MKKDNLTPELIEQFEREYYEQIANMTYEECEELEEALYKAEEKKKKQLIRLNQEIIKMVVTAFLGIIALAFGHMLTCYVILAVIGFFLYKSYKFRLDIHSTNILINLLIEDIQTYRSL